MMDILRQIQLLREEINQHNTHYYVQDSPVVSDAEYDQLMRKLEKLEMENPNSLPLILQRKELEQLLFQNFNR